MINRNVMPNLNGEFLQGTWLYLMNTSSEWNRTKIGMTKNNPMKRFANLRCGDPYLCLALAFYIPPSCPIQAIDFEQMLHAQYDHIRIEFHKGGPSEWFQKDCRYFEQQIEKFIEDQFEDQSWLVAGFSDDSIFSGHLIVKVSEHDLERLFGPPPQVDEYDIPW